MPFTLLTGLYAKLAGVLLVLAALAALFMWGHHEGALSVQTRWDAAKAVQTAAAAEQALQTRATEDNQRNAFNALAAKYEEAIHAPQPSFAEHLAPAVAAGTVRLRDESAAVCSGQMPVVAARARIADAATASAATQRLADSIAAVRAGDEADQREHVLDQQIIALQALLEAERQQSPVQ